MPPLTPSNLYSRVKVEEDEAKYFLSFYLHSTTMMKVNVDEAKFPLLLHTHSFHPVKLTEAES